MGGELNAAAALLGSIAGGEVVDLSVPLDERYPAAWPAHMPFQRKVYAWFEDRAAPPQHVAGWRGPYHTGWITLDEVDAGKSLVDDVDYGEPPAARSLAQVLDDDRARAFCFDADIDAPPAFVVGQQVLTAKNGYPGHTRLPQYARGRIGTIHAYNGAHVFPDLSAEGTEVHQHCYNVMFEI